MMIFPRIPTMNVDESQISEQVHYGGGNVVTIVSDTSKEDYVTFLNDLKETGFDEYVVNEEGVGGTVFSAIYTKGKWVITVTYAERTKKTYISTCFDLPLSKHLHYDDAYVVENKAGAKTSLHMLEMWHFGNSFVVQLKNGHFLVSDGGGKEDAPILVDYLENLTPEGEKPVVEAWFFSHGHGDHCGIMGQFFDDRTLCERIYVEGFYYNEPSIETMQMDPGTRIVGSWMKGAAGVMKTAEGTRPKLYRPQTGQRYYFCDITVDVVHAQEQLLREDYSGDINDSSTWLMLHIEGQKILLTGDGEKGCMKMMMEHYTKEYLDVDIMTLMHHGFNTQDSFTDYCKVKTLLVTTRRVTPVRKANENTYLKDSVEEYYDWSDGTKILTFPYEIGSFKSLEANDWKQKSGQGDSTQPNCYRYPSSHKNKEVRYFRPIKDNGFTKCADYLIQSIGKRMPIRYMEDGMLMELCVDASIHTPCGYQIFFNKFVGWTICGVDEEALLRGIDMFVDSATWTETGFTAKETEL